jgi:hypothetical protein
MGNIRNRKEKQMTTQIIKINGGYQVTFTQGVQTFGINNVGTKKECKWVKKMLDKAFDNFKSEILNK